MRFRLLRAAALGFGLAAALVACDGWDPRSPFERNAPEVSEALRELDAGRARPASETLARYLGTGPCSADAGIALPPSIREKPNGAFDLGLTLFALGEQYGQRFGDEDRTPPGQQAPPPAQGQLPFKLPGQAGGGQGQQDQALAEKRAREVECALLVVRAIAADPQVPVELRARAYYLAGNLEFLLQKYEEAVKEYDQALALVPGVPADAGDGIGRDAAWNRAIALRRQEQHDAGPDSPPDASDKPDAESGDGGNDGSSGNDGGDKGDGGGGKPDAGNDGGSPPDGGDKDKPDGGGDNDGGGEPPPPPPAASQSATPQQDARLLEQLEQAPSYQGQEAKARAAQRRGRPTMEDK